MRLTYGEALREALFAELDGSDNVVMFGQDIQHNLYGYTEGLVTAFGENRVVNTPLSEAAVVGAAIGASMCGVRTIVDLTVSNFLYVAMDQIVNMAAKTIYMYDGQYKLPITIMCSSMYNASNGSQHSDRSHPMLMNVPGLKIVAPARPQDAYSLLRSSIQDDSPVVCFTDRSIFYNEQEVDLSFEVELGEANLLMAGTDVTIVAISGAVSIALSAAAELKDADISVDVIDVRTLVPLDKKTILKSVAKTGRVVIVDSAHKTCSAASEISSIIAEDIFEHLKSPIAIVAYDDVPIPFARELESVLAPSKEKVIEKIKYLLNFSEKS